MGKTLVLYVFHIINNRVTHFINNAIFYDATIDFIVISNDKKNKIELPDYVRPAGIRNRHPNIGSPNQY